MGIRPLALIADPCPARRRTMAATLAELGCEVCHVERPGEVVPGSSRHRPTLVVIAFAAVQADAVFSDIDRMRQADRRLPILLVVGQSSESIAIAALRAGVKDYFPEPLDHAALATSARRCLAAIGTRSAGAAPTARPESARPGSFVGESESTRRIRSCLINLARHDATVLVTGETGTGKELAATLIHDGSARRRARFVSVNCAAIPEGLLESELFGYESGAFTGAARAREGLLQLADHGTVFLDEIGEMGSHAQAKMLRALEAREIYRLGGRNPVRLDVRVIAATNQDLERAVEEGRFRRDLYFRLNVARVHLPPLREHPSDIASLIDHGLRELNIRHSCRVEGFTDEALQGLLTYDWPGNVRELKNLLEAIFVSSPPARIAPENLPDAFRQRLRSVCSVPEAERRRIVEALLATNWNKSRAAELLSWSRMTVYRKIAKYSVVRSVDPLVRPAPDTSVARTLARSGPPVATGAPRSPARVGGRAAAEKDGLPAP
jgi:DNA-binding NtrC family response regulator